MNAKKNSASTSDTSMRTAIEAQRKLAMCVFCDGMCTLAGVVENGELVRLEDAEPMKPIMCRKAANWKSLIGHLDRLTSPLKNVGTRETPVFEQVSWESALDDIASRLKRIIKSYGPQAVAVSDMPINHQVGAGVVRRLFNLIGTPNYITPVELCMGNTAQIHRLTYGWYSLSNYDNTDCVVYFGQTRSPDNWPKEYLDLQAARQRGAKLIVVDPRRSELAATADYHVSLRYGTDAALLLGWLNVIIEEGLYDSKIVKNACTGFDELVERIKEYPVDTVAEICGVSPEVIRDTARLYATSKASIIPWGVTTDMQLNSTSALRCQCILRAICGFLGKSEMLFGPGLGVVSVSELEMHEALGKEQEALQLGYENYPLFSYRGLEFYKDVSKRFFGTEYVNLLNGACMAHPPTVFEAMRTEKPYPVKALFSFANNTLLGYANQQGIHDALKKIDLLVVYDLFLTPTAQMADYVLPGDTWLERESLGPQLDLAPMASANNKFCTSPLGCKDLYFVVSELAKRLDLGEYFPWRDQRELIDYRIKDFDKLLSGDTNVRILIPHLARGPKPLKPFTFMFQLARKKLGRIATPSGKIELYSTILKELGYDPLPYYREPAPDADRAKYPLTVFIGLREPTSYNTALRQISALRAQLPEPLLLINPADVENYGLSDGGWVVVETEHGKMSLVCCADEAQPEGTIRVPHGWWKPETEMGASNGYSEAMQLGDGMIVSDAPENLDPEQGLPNLRGGIFARVYALQLSEFARREKL